MIPIDRNLSGDTTPSQSGPRSDGNKGVPRIPQSSSLSAHSSAVFYSHIHDTRFWIKVRSLDGDTDYFDIVAGVQQEDILALYLFIICLDYVLITSIDKIKEIDFELTKERSRS